MSSQILGVSQTEIETEFYMKDISFLVQDKHEREKQEKLNDYFIQLQLLIASNQRIMDPKEYENLVRSLTKNLEGKGQESNKLDRQALETLRFMTNQGANRTGGG